MSIPTESVAALYDWRASRGGTTQGYEPIASADIALLAQRIKLSDARTCDVGCGNGTHLQALVGAGAPFPTGIDLSEASLCTLLDADWAGATVLIKADITTWKIGPIFDGVICSLPPINRASDFGIEALLAALCSITSPGGHILLKLFDGHRVREILGTHSVTYEGAETAKVSTIEHSPQRGSININQHFSDMPEDIWTEVVHTPTKNEVICHARAIGMHATATDQEQGLPGTRTYMLTRSAS